MDCMGMETITILISMFHFCQTNCLLDHLPANEMPLLTAEPTVDTDCMQCLAWCLEE